MRVDVLPGAGEIDKVVDDAFIQIGYVRQVTRIFELAVNQIEIKINGQ